MKNLNYYSLVIIIHEHDACRNEVSTFELDQNDVESPCIRLK